MNWSSLISKKQRVLPTLTPCMTLREGLGDSGDRSEPALTVLGYLRKLDCMGGGMDSTGSDRDVDSNPASTSRPLPGKHPESSRTDPGQASFDHLFGPFLITPNKPHCQAAPGGAFNPGRIFTQVSFLVPVRKVPANTNRPMGVSGKLILIIGRNFHKIIPSVDRSSSDWEGPGFMSRSFLFHFPIVYHTWETG